MLQLRIYGFHPYPRGWDRGLIVLLTLLSPATAISAGCNDSAQRVVLYPVPNGDRGERIFREFVAAAQEDGLIRDFCVQLKKIAIDSPSPGRDTEVRDLLRQQGASSPAAILAPSPNIAESARSAYPDSPVIFYSNFDAVDIGLVASYRRPGGQVTGYSVDLKVEQKLIELLVEAFPSIRRVGVVLDSVFAPAVIARFKSRPVHLSDRTVVTQFVVADDLSVFRSAVRAAAPHVDGWIVPFTWLPYEHPREVVSMLRATGRPAIYGNSMQLAFGGELAYEPVLDDVDRVWIRMLRQILAGTSPGEIPIERPKRMDFVVNLPALARLPTKPTSSSLLRSTRVVRDVMPDDLFLP